MKKILIPTDFSECAEYATEVAANIAKRTGARLYVLHVMDIPVYDRNDSFRSYSNAAEGIFWMKLVKKRYKELFEKPFMKEVNAIQVLQFDGIYQTISRQAKEHEIDLIVMGSHGSSGAHEVFIGSNTEKVVRLAECPVLTVKSRLPEFDLKNVVFASNFLGEAPDNFEKLFDFTNSYDAHLHLVKIVTPDRFETTEYTNTLIESFVSKWKLKNYTTHIVNARSIQDGIVAQADKLEVDAICMETHGRTGISRMIQGSLAESIVNRALLPVLTIRIPDQDSSFNPFSNLV